MLKTVSMTHPSSVSTHGRRLLQLLSAMAIVLLLIQGTSASSEATARYPNLVPLPPTELGVPGTLFLGGPTDAPLAVDGCLIDEKVRRGAGRCLRFDTSVANLGVGPFEVLYRVEPSGETVAYQRIYPDGGPAQTHRATNSEFHATHAHFHIADFYVARLWASKSNGKPRGLEPLATSTKNGFCPEDSRTVSGEEDSDSYSCLFGTGQDRGSAVPGSVVGISAGWMDTYPANLPDQYIDIEGVADGRYVLQISIDPNDVFREADEADNNICTLIALEGDAASPERVVPCGTRRSTF